MSDPQRYPSSNQEYFYLTIVYILYKCSETMEEIVRTKRFLI